MSKYSETLVETAFELVDIDASFSHICIVKRLEVPNGWIYQTVFQNLHKSEQTNELPQPVVMQRFVPDYGPEDGALYISYEPEGGDKK